MRKTAQNALFTIAFAGMLSVSIATIGAKKLHMPLPQALELKRDKSYLEGKAYAKLSSPTRKTVLDGSFQSNFDTFLADRFPRRDDVLMLNAAWQRQLISGAAAVSGYSVYPTFYGSSYVYDAERDMVVQTLAQDSDASRKQYADAVAAYNAFAERNAGKRLFFYRVDRQSSSSNNPTDGLVSDPLDTEWLTEHFFGKLDSAYTLIDGSYADADSLAQAFYRTDHHWNGFAAYDGYATIMQAMNPGEPLCETLDARTYDVPFYGSTARSGLMETAEPDLLEDRPIDLTGIKLYINGKKRNPEMLQRVSAYEKGDVDPDTFFNRYANYYHTDYALVDIRNENAQTDKTLFIVGDSFSNSVERYFSSYYARVVSYDARHNKKSVQEVLDEVGADDVLFLMGSTTFPSATQVKQMQ